MRKKCPYSCFPIRLPSTNGYTLVEVMISFSLLILISIGIFGSIHTLHQISRQQATYASVLALVIQEQEAIRSLHYAPPNLPFSAETQSMTQMKSVSLNSAGEDYRVQVSIVRRFELLSSGHRVTVAATYLINGHPITIETTTLINKYSSVS